MTVALSALRNELKESGHPRAEWDMAVALSASCNELEESDHARSESGTWQWLCQHRVTSSKNQITHVLRVGHGSDSVSIV